MADPSGSGEPVPAPTCDRATQEALEALRWLEHCATTPAPDDPDARGVRNAQIEDAFATVRAALGSARPPLPPQEMPAEFADEWAGRLWVRLITIDGPETNQEAEDAAKFIRDVIAAYEALRVRGEPPRSKVLVCPDCDGTEHVAGSDGATPFCVECEDVEMGWTYRRRATDHEPEAVRGEPSLEEIAREAVAELERIRQSVNKRYPQSGLHGTADFLVGELMSAVLLTFAPLRARLSSPEAPRT